MATTESTAAVQGRLWGARAKDWADIQEPAQRDLYPPVLDAAGIGPGTRLLDVGCGSGVAAAIAHDKGATVSGLDAAAAAIANARRRVPAGDFRVGELERLPYADDAFDVVTGFNAFQYAADPAHAVAEARRVGNVVAILTWGLPEECEAAGYVRALGSVMPPPPPGAPGPFALSTPGALQDLARAAGLEPRSAGTVLASWRFPDYGTALRGMLSAGPAVKAIEHAGQEHVEALVAGALAPYRTAAGGYVLENTWRYVIAA
jgi:SAM-dependent methyltransferase